VKRFILPLAAAAVVALPGMAAAQIDFETDPVGFVGNGFVSDDEPLVQFIDSDGADLEIRDFGAQSDGRAIAANFDDASKLIMSFLQPFTALSFQFGNDDPGFIMAGQLAILDLFLGTDMVGQATVAVNANDLMDQTIGFSGTAFDRAEFYYETNLIEVVDNIEYTVPEGDMAVMLAIGLLGLVATVRRRQAV
jgi:hypothetical protein